MRQCAPCAPPTSSGCPHAPHGCRQVYMHTLLHRRWSHKRHAYPEDFTQFTESDADDPFAGLKWVQQNEAELRRQAELEEQEQEKAQSVGLYVRGRPPSNEVQINEDDPERYPWHRKLAMLGPSGDYQGAEGVMLEMSRNGFPPGPRAYHALVYSYLRGDSVEGALDAIRREVKAGIQPLPESYAAVVQGYVQRGDTSMAEAVWASNRRSGVGCGPSWVVLTTALFAGGQEERAMQLLEQGESEGLRPEAGLYAQLISYLCRLGDVDTALQRLQEMEGEEREALPGPEHFTPIIDCLAGQGDMEGAEGVMREALGRTQSLPLKTLNNMLRGYLTQHLPPDTLQSKLELYEGWAGARSGTAPDAEARALLLEAALQLGDRQAALSHWSFMCAGTAGLQLHSLMDDTLAKLIQQLSLSDLPLDLYGVVKAVYEDANRADIPHSTFLQTDAATGCSAMAVWFHRRLREGRLELAAAVETIEGEGEEEGEGPEFLSVDGVRLDPASLRAVDAKGKPMAISRLTVREMRAELTARRQPLYGNKKELTARLERARKAFEQGGTKSESTSSATPYEVTEETWDNGTLVYREKVTYYLQKSQEGVAADALLYRTGGDDQFEEEEQEEEEDDDDEEWYSRRRQRRQRSTGEDNEDDNDDDDDDATFEDATMVEHLLEESVRKAQSRLGDSQPSALQFSLAPKFTNQTAGLHEMLLMHRAAVELGGCPSRQDMADVVEACVQQEEESAAQAVLTLLEVLRESDPAAHAAAVGPHELALQDLAAQHREERGGWGAQGAVVGMTLEDYEAADSAPVRWVRGERQGPDLDFDADWEELFDEFDT